MTQYQTLYRLIRELRGHTILDKPQFYLVGGCVRDAIMNGTVKYPWFESESIKDFKVPVLHSGIPVKFKQMHPLAVLPQYSKVGDAGLDLTAVGVEENKDFGFKEYDTGLAVEIPNGYVGLIFPRSSISKTYQTLSNSVGVIDSNYRGEIKFRFFTNSVFMFDWLIGAEFIDDPGMSIGLSEHYKVGDRIGQLIIIPYPTILPEWADELSDTERGDGGFGSTGK